MWVRVDLRVMIMKSYSMFPRAPEQEPHYQMQDTIIVDEYFDTIVYFVYLSYFQSGD